MTETKGGDNNRITSEKRRRPSTVATALRAREIANRKEEEQIGWVAKTRNLNPVDSEPESNS